MRLCSLRKFCVFLAVILRFRGSDAEVVCEDFVAGNNVAVNDQTMELLEERNVTLQDLIDCLDTDGSVIFDLAEIAVPAAITIRRSVRFLSTPGLRTRLMCNNQTMFDIRAGTVELSHLEVNECMIDEFDGQSGASAAFIVRSKAQVAFQSVRFTENSNSRGPAILKAENDSVVTIRNCRFEENAGRDASILETGSASRIVIARSIFHRNRGSRGALVLNDPERVVVSNSTFTQNVATRRSGGAFLVKGGKTMGGVMIRGRCLFEANEALADGGGALSMVGNVSLTIEGGVRFSHNSAAKQGGAISVHSALDIRVNNTLFAENSSNFTGGGAIFVENTEQRTLSIMISATLFLRVSSRSAECPSVESCRVRTNWSEYDSNDSSATESDRRDIRQRET